MEQTLYTLTYIWRQTQLTIRERFAIRRKERDKKSEVIKVIKQKEKAPIVDRQVIGQYPLCGLGSQWINNLVVRIMLFL